MSKRIPIELADAQSEDMRTAGIYYWYDDANMRHGKAMIIGPVGTPYEACPLVFSFQFPDRYPFEPFLVKFLTTDGRTRFHPNLYVEGKVCLSILGTWRGPEWNPLLNLRTVLTTLQSLLCENPITNEPGYENLTLERGGKAHAYAAYVQYRLAALTLKELAAMRGGECPPTWFEFQEEMGEIAPQLYGKLAAIVRKRTAAEHEFQEFKNLPYGMVGGTRWKELEKLVEAAGDMGL